jgi:hypothetical protein
MGLRRRIVMSRYGCLKMWSWRTVKEARRNGRDKSCMWEEVVVMSRYGCARKRPWAVVCMGGSGRDEPLGMSEEIVVWAVVDVRINGRGDPLCIWEEAFVMSRYGWRRNGYMDVRKRRKDRRSTIWTSCIRRRTVFFEQPVVQEFLRFIWDHDDSWMLSAQKQSTKRNWRVRDVLGFNFSSLKRFSFP